MPKVIDVNAEMKKASVFEGRIRSVARFANVPIKPHWASNNSQFWYHREISADSSEFVLVDLISKISRPAFDHVALASRLASEMQRDIRPGALPFQWIAIDPANSSVSFQIDNKLWVFGSDGVLERGQGKEERQPQAEILDEEVPSAHDGDETSVTFLNNTNEKVDIYWIDFQRKVHSYGSVEAGKQKNQQTYEGHVWRVDGADGEVLGLLRAIRESTTYVISKSPESQAKKESGGRKPILNPFGAWYYPAEDEAEPSTENKNSDVFVKEFNVWSRDINGNETRLTNNGRENNPYDDELYLCPGGDFVVVWQYTPAADEYLHRVEAAPRDQSRPKLHSTPYLRPGDKVREDRPRIISLENKGEVATDDSLFINPFRITNLGWSKDGCEYRFLFNERGHQCLRILAMSKSGNVRTIIEETSQSFIDYSSKTYYHLVEDTNELIWASERDGRNHLYLFDIKTGGLKNRITKGDYVVRAVDRIDVEERQIWFNVYGINPAEDPYYAHLARINFDGTGLTILTKGDGMHTWEFSPDKKYFVDSWSRVDCPPRRVLRDATTGTEHMTLEQGSLDPLTSINWSVPERFSTTGRDDTTPIFGIITKPLNFDPTKTYPIIEDIYAGPHDFHVPKAFNSLVSHQLLARAGYVVVKIDGMGTNWRTRAFHDVCYKNIGDAGFPDRKLWIRAAAKTRPWMDVSRVGVYGTSAGGQSAMGALIFHNEFYKAAVADSGCHSLSLDKLWWPEQFMGWPIDESYDACSNIVHAGRLEGALLLMTGGMDKNVDSATTMQAVEALSNARKYYELVMFPSGGHGPGIGSPYGNYRMIDFFDRML